MNIENVNLTEELILKAGACQTIEEMMALAHENGVTITMEQLPELMAEIAKKCSGEISDDALEAASTVGGKASYTDKDDKKYKVVTVLYYCADCTCKKCGANFSTDGKLAHSHGCGNYGMDGGCGICEYMVYKDGLWLCPVINYI